MTGRIATAVLLVSAIVLTLAFGSRLRHQPAQRPLPSDSAISTVIRAVNVEQGRHWLRTGGDPAGHIDLRDSYDYRKNRATPVDDPFLATIVVRPRDTKGFLYTADISAANYRTQRAAPFTRLGSGHVCIDFDDSGEIVTRERRRATYRC